MYQDRTDQESPVAMKSRALMIAVWCLAGITPAAAQYKIVAR